MILSPYVSDENYIDFLKKRNLPALNNQIL